MNLKGANLAGVVLDQAWSLNSDLTGANLRGASLFATQFGGSKLDGADPTKARVAGDFTNASLTKAIFDGADLSADEKNQSMGLMRAPSRKIIGCVVAAGCPLDYRPQSEVQYRGSNCSFAVRGLFKQIMVAAVINPRILVNVF